MSEASKEKSIKQRRQLKAYPKAQDWYGSSGTAPIFDRYESEGSARCFASYEPYEYKSYLPELHEGKPTPPKDLPQDIKQLFDRLNTQGLSHPRDPLCTDLNYTKNKYRFSVVPEEIRASGTPQEIQERYKYWFLNDWKQRSMIHKLASILWYLPSHIYRKYFSTVDYRWYYNGLVSFVDRTYKKLVG